MATKTICVVTIDGQNVSSAIMPYLTDITITDKAGNTQDTCQFEFDDRNGQILLPRQGVPVSVELGNDENPSQIAFTGTVDEVTSKGSRSSGMTLSVSAKSADTNSKAKQPRKKHWDKKKIGEVLSDAAKDSDIDEVVVAPSLAEITREYWAMQNESFLAFAQRVAREVGGTFKVVGRKAIVADRNAGKSASGQDLPTFAAVMGVNLISWDISPEMGRPRYKTIKVRHYDKKQAKWVEEEQQVQDDGAKAEFVDRFTAADKDEAKARAKSHAKTSEREKGGGTIVVDGSTAPQPEATVILIGARPGVDGTYTIDTVTQNYSRSGWTTSLSVKKPAGESGKDSRGSKTAAKGK
ncbi:hypothetical protein BA190_09285 [Labrys sp. WJW]|uniref:phage late control D family protein n=1 Tax=Labrys sp. WJW TaxID=1737983 RepID=UPI00082EE915|nr:contractile injection system protein, VgrG/Pvc8 family [Labrys sp. WJW]OCC05098.1 hypothetical protein BA190_09285 [Labrys sp. WJW]